MMSHSITENRRDSSIYSKPDRTFYHHFSLLMAALIFSVCFTAFAHATEQQDWYDFQSNLFSGSYGYNYKIDLPPGNNGMTPLLANSYRSFTAKSDPSLISPGWSIPTSYIQANIDGTFALVLNGAKHDLVFKEGRYHTRVETYLKIEKKSGASNDMGDYWTVLNTNGTEYRFGSNSDAEALVHTSNPLKTPTVWRWSLDQVKDTNGNYIHYSYIEDKGSIYPRQIEYNNDRLRVIQFILEDRPDSFLTIDQGSEVYATKRLKKIDISLNNKTIKSFILDYSPATPQDPRSRLTAITKCGIDGSVLPPTKFIYKALDAGFSNYSTLSSPPTAFRQIDTTTSTSATNRDINGDGLIDHLDSSTTPWQVNLNTGSGFMASVDWPGAPAGPLTAIDISGNVTQDLIDINGDDLLDVVIANSAGTWDVYLNTGNGFAPSISWAVPGSEGFIRTVTQDPAKPGTYVVTRDLLDVTGDGVVDIVSKGASGWQVAVNKSGQAGLLEKILEDLGGTSTVIYASSNSYADNKLPLNYWVVSSVTTDNGLPVDHPQHNSSTSTFSYSLGGYDTASKEFRGFGRVTEIRPDYTKAIHWYFQDDALKGKKAKTLITDAFGNPYTETVNTWSSITANGNFTATLDRIQDYTYDGKTETPKVTVTDYKYDLYGNATHEIRYGDADAYGDELFIFREYTYNQDLWIVDRMKHSYSAESSSGKHIRESWFYYDGNNDINAQPIRGNLTKEELFLDSGENPITSHEYDNYGNRTSTIDPEKRQTTITYDNFFHTFPISVTNAKGQTTYREVDPANGQPIEDKDPNGYITKYKYDVFGRLIMEIKEGDSEAYPTTEITYPLNEIVPKYIKLSRREQSGAANTLDSFLYIDGLGRLIQTKSEYTNNTNFITSDIYYDATGRDYKHSNPYLTDSSTSYSFPLTVPSTVTNYDPLGRPIRTTNPDNTFTSTVYDHWLTTTTDENGRIKKRLYDANKNLRQVVENNHVGARGGTVVAIDESYTTNYLYNVLGELLQTKDHHGNTVNYLYDTLGRKLTSIDPDQGRKDFAYDLVGNLRKQTDARGITTEYRYDPLNRPLQVIYPKERGIEYKYDLETIGTLSQVVDGVGSVAYKYDNRLRRNWEERTMDGMVWVSRWDYDSMDRPVSQTYPDNSTVSFFYNTMGELDNIPNILNKVDYNVNGLATKQTYANNLSTSFGYFPHNLRLNSIITPGIQDFSYEYDDIGNLKKIINATISANKRTETFTYDDLERLVNAEDLGINGYKSTYEYNAIGNMLVETGVKNSSTAVAQYTYGLNGAGPHAVTGKTDDKPIVALFSVDDGKAYATTQEVRLNNVSIGNPTEFMASESPDFNGASWKPYGAAPTFILSAGYGKKTIYLKVRKNSIESAFKIADVEFLPDTDGDGMPNTYDNDDNNNGIPDKWELQYGLATDPAIDTDGDGLTSLQEYQYGTDPTKADSDGDGWTDYAEIFVHYTNPTLTDMDNDGIPDGVDMFPFTPFQDGQSEHYLLKRASFSQNGEARQSDGYILHDALQQVGFNQGGINRRESETFVLCDALGRQTGYMGAIDTDGDGIPNIADADDDNDGMPDAWEIADSLNPLDPTDAQKDEDGDGLINLQECLKGTKPRLADSDADGVNDYLEVYVLYTIPNGNDPAVSVDSDGDRLSDAIDPDPIHFNTYGSSERYTLMRGNFNAGASRRVSETFVARDLIANGETGVLLTINSGLSIIPAVVDFGKFASGGTPSRLTITNTGSNNVALSNMTIVGENPYEFDVVTDNCSGKNLSASGNCSLDILLSPSYAGVKSAQMQIPTSDSNTPLLVSKLSGIVAGMSDKQPPTGSLLINYGHPKTNSNFIVLKLSAQDASGVAQMCVSNDNVCPGWEPYTVTKAWTLPSGDGAKSVYAWYRDNLGNSTTSATISTVTLDTLPPTVTPSLRGGLYKTAQLVTLTASEPGIIYYTLNGTNPSPTSVVYTSAISLTSNAALKFVSYDDAGNASAVQTEQYVIDSTSPSLTVTAPVAGSWTNLSTVTLKGKVTDGTRLNSFTVNGSEVSLAYDGSFSKVLSLVQGSNLIKSVAIDEAGNQTTDSRFVVLDQQAPSANISLPASGQTIYGSSYIIQGIADDGTGSGIERVEVSTDGGQNWYIANGKASWSYTWQLPPPGSCTLKIRAVDVVGNVGQTVDRSVSVRVGYRLDITINGTGSGTVSSAEYGIACNSSCGGVYDNGSALLFKVDPYYSVFTGWSGACTGTGDCLISLLGNTSVTATFAKDQDHVARISGQPPIYFPGLQAAYTAAPANSTIQLWGIELAEKCNFNRNIPINLKGGYDEGYASTPGITKIRGRLTISKGKVTVKKLVIR